MDTGLMISPAIGWRTFRLLRTWLIGFVATAGPALAVAVPPDLDASSDRPFEAARPADRLPRNVDPGSARSGRVAEGVDFADTGGDTCLLAEVIPVPVGEPGNPLTVTTTGDTSSATGPDCQDQLAFGWWEAFDIDRCARVTIDYCGSPRECCFRNADIVTDTCEVFGLVCGPFYTAEENTLLICNDGNPSITFEALAPGTYYYPVIIGSDPAALGPYEMHITAEACEGACEGCLGACCTSRNRTCEDGVHKKACANPGQQWSYRELCADTNCELEAHAVELMSQVSLAEFSSGSTGGNDVWGYVSPAGREYAIIGMTQGTGFVDITVPQEPVVVADIPDDNSVWSDIATFGHYAYNVNEHGGGMQIIDMSAIDEGIVTLVGSMTENGFTDAHNVFVNPASGYAYLCGANAPTAGLVAVSLDDPAAPVIAGVWDEVYVHDVFVTSYQACPYAGRAGPCEIAFVFAGAAGLKMVDVTNKAEMTTITTLAYPGLRYCHQGWLSTDRRILFMGDEADETSLGLTTTTHIVNVENVALPIHLGTFTNGLPSIDHNLMVRGKLVFEANYRSGLRVFDATDLGNVTEVGYLDTHPAGDAAGFEGAWGVYTDFPSGLVAVSDMQEGLFVLRACLDDGGVLGDVNGSGRVDLADFARVQQCFHALPMQGKCLPSDTDCDLDVDADDFAAFSKAIIDQG